MTLIRDISLLNVPLFESAIKISHEHVAKVVEKAWSLKLGELLKES